MSSLRRVLYLSLFASGAVGLPAWVPAYGTVSAIAGTASNPSKLSDHLPGSGPWNSAGSDLALTTAWNEAVYNIEASADYGELVLAAAGGDRDRTGSDGYGLQLLSANPTYRRMVNPYGGFTNIDPGPPTNWSATTGDFDSTEIPLAPHQYDNSYIIPAANAGGSPRLCLPIGMFAWLQGNFDFRGHMMRLDMATQSESIDAWRRAATTTDGNNPARNGDATGSAVWDNVNNRGIIIPTGTGSPITVDRLYFIGSLDANGVGTWSSKAIASETGLGANTVAHFWTEENLVVVAGSNGTTFGIQLYDPNLTAGADAMSVITVTGTLPPHEGGYGMCYVPRLRSFYIQTRGSSANKQKIWRIQAPATSVTTNAWVSSEITMPGDTVDYNSVNTIGKRFAYCNKNNLDCIIWFHDINGKTYAYRPELS